MTLPTVSEKVATQTVNLFERATELRFFLHFLCVALYLDIVALTMTGNPLQTITLDKIQHIQIGKSILVAFGYFFVMGYALRIFYGFMFIIFHRLDLRFGFSDHTNFFKERGWVRKSDVLQISYEKKDNELRKAMDAREETCQKERKEQGEFGYLAFSALVLVGLNYFLVPNGFLGEGNARLGGLIGNQLGHLLSVALLLPALVFIWQDWTDDDSRDWWLYHLPLYNELKKEKESEKH
jgi:hypothetical protein